MRKYREDLNHITEPEEPERANQIACGRQREDYSELYVLTNHGRIYRRETASDKVYWFEIPCPWQSDFIASKEEVIVEPAEPAPKQ